MVWTDITRAQYERKSGRYASDCSSEEWALIEPFMTDRKATGRPGTTSLRGCLGCHSIHGLNRLPMGHDPQ